MNSRTLALLAAACLCIDWTRLTGKVKAINLRDSAVTIQTFDGNLLTIPIDYQVKITTKHEEMVDLKHLVLDDKVVLTRILSDRPKEVDDTTGMALPEASQRGK